MPGKPSVSENVVYTKTTIAAVSSKPIEFPIMSLNEYIQKSSNKDLGKATFDMAEERENEGKKEFVICCSLGSKKTKAVANSKKEAKQMAAKAMLCSFDDWENVLSPPPAAATPVTPKKKKANTPKQKTPVVAKIKKAQDGTPEPILSAAGLLNQAAQRFKKELVWKVSDGEKTAPNEQTFTCDVILGDWNSTATGTSKKDSKNNAAQKILEVIEKEHAGWNTKKQPPTPKNKPTTNGTAQPKKAGNTPKKRVQNGNTPAAATKAKVQKTA